MKTNFSIVVWMMVFSVLLKMLIYFFNLQFTGYERMALFGNVFILMSGVYLGIKLFKKTETNKTVFLQDVKAGMRVASLYALFMTLFVYFYYSKIDPTYFDQRLASQLSLAEENGANLANAKEMGEFVLSPYFQSTITLVGFLILGSFYASIITFLLRKFNFER